MSAVAEIAKARNRKRAKKFRVIQQPEIATLHGGDLAVKEFILDTVQKGAPDIDVTESIIAGEILLTMEGAPQVTVTVHDQARKIIKSGAFWDEDGELRAADVKLDGLWWRLIKIQKQGDDLVFAFEDRNVTWLRGKRGPRKIGARSKVTRAQAVLVLVRAVQQKRILWTIPELKKKQPIAKTTPGERKRAAKESDDDRSPGFDHKIKIDGVSKGQLENIQVFMREADRLNAPELAVQAGICAGFGESNWSKAAVDHIYHTHKGVFQSDQIPPNDLQAQSHHFLVGGRSFKAGGAIGAAKAHPNWTPGQIALYVEISDASGASFYDKFLPRAKRIIEAWGGGTGSIAEQDEYYKQYVFEVEKDETYWDAIQRMAQEVNWRAFFSGGRFYYMSEQRLYGSRARYRISERDAGVTNIDFDQDYRKKIATARVECRLDRWQAPPGTVVVVEGLNSTGSDRWLVESVRRNLFSPDAEINLKRPMRKRKEPRSQTATRNATGADSALPPSGKLGNIDGDTAGLRKEMQDLLRAIAGETDEKIFVNDGKATSGHAPGSLHYKGLAADIDVGGDARQSSSAARKGDLIAVAVLVCCGFSRSMAHKMLGGPRTNFTVNSQWNGCEIEIGWRTLEGGNHYNHVHVGIQSLPPDYHGPVRPSGGGI